MTIKLPKHLKGMVFDKIMPINMSAFDVDLLLPQLFFKAITQGKDYGRRPNDPTLIKQYIDDFSVHQDITGFGDEDGRRLLERVTRTALIYTGKRGQSQRGEQIMALKEYTLLAFKPGYPHVGSTLRRVDDLIYRMLRDETAGTSLREFFRNTFGVGLKLKMGGDPDGIYDGQTELDTMTRLSLAFLDGFATTGIRDPKERPMREAIPVIAKYMARDIRRYIQIYRNYMPTEVLLYNFKSLIIFELFIYSLKLFTAITELIEDGEKMPLAMLDDLSVTDFSPPELFLDFTSGTNLFAKEMATACVRRDLELMQRFIYDNITLRTLDRYVGGIRGNIQSKKIVEDILGNEDGGPEYLQGLLRLLKHPQISLRIEVAAQRDEEDIRKVNRTDGADDEISRDESTNEIEIERITSAAESDFERTVLLIVDAQRAIISQNVTSWYTSVGGLSKPFGILGGHSKNRRSLRYAPSNDLLALLVQMAALDITAEQTGRLEPQSIRLRDFLTYLYNRFGILVDRPPQEFTGAEYVAAAQDNLRAMLRRLQQMGVFRDLSDDFTVQRLTPPYADAPKEAVQS